MYQFKLSKNIKINFIFYINLLNQYKLNILTDKI